MLFALDAHALGRHLTGIEVYARNLLRGLAATDKESDFVAYVSVDEAGEWIQGCSRIRKVSVNPFVRLGFQLSMNIPSISRACARSSCAGPCVEP